MTEADFQTKFTKWSKYNIKKTAVFELKLSKTGSLPFTALAEHQKNSLLIAQNGCLRHKIADVGLIPKPMDYFVICDCPAFVVVMFYKRAQKEFFMIPIDNWIIAEQDSKRKSLTPALAKVLGISCKLE